MPRERRLELAALLFTLTLVSGCSSARAGLLEGFESLQDPDPNALIAPRVESPREEIATLLARGSEGSEEAAIAARTQAEAYAAIAPGPVADAYLGASRLLVAKFSGNPFSKLGEARKGLALLDGAVSLRPKDVEVRYLRASTTFPLPSFLGHEDEAEADVTWLAERLDQDHAFLTPRRSALVLLQLAILCLEDGRKEESIELLKRAITLAPTTAPGLRAQKELDALLAR